MVIHAGLPDNQFYDLLSQVSLIVEIHYTDDTYLLYAQLTKGDEKGTVCRLNSLVDW